MARFSNTLAALMVWSMLVGGFVALAGAGIYGSPLTGVPSPELWWRVAFLVACPAAAFVAMVVNTRWTYLARGILGLGILISYVTGGLTDFRYVWWWVYLFIVWTPMVIWIIRGR